jgi:hypothetical protein
VWGVISDLWRDPSTRFWLDKGWSLIPGRDGGVLMETGTRAQSLHGACKQA